MQEMSEVTAMVLKSAPAGENDRRVVLLTKERGKISAFARGARRQGSRLLGVTDPFIFGRFRIYEGRSAYQLAEADVLNYFEGFREDLEAACYGMYFLELADFYGRENDDDADLLKLLYQSLRALLHAQFPNKLVRAVFEMKSIVLAGEFPGVPTDGDYLADTLYTVRFIMETPMEKLYTFAVSDAVLEELQDIAARCQRRIIDRPLKSLSVLEGMVE